MQRRYIFILFLLFLAVAGSFNRRPPSGSTFVAGNYGTQALFTLLEQIDVKPQRFLQPFENLPADKTGYTLFVISPPEAGGAQYLADWVGAGNRLVFFDEPAGKNEKLLEKLGIHRPSVLSHEFELPKPAGETAEINVDPAADPAVQNVFDGVTSISTPRGFPVIATSTQTPLIQEGKLTSALRSGLEKGDVWYFIGAEPVQNRLIDIGDNLRLVLQLILHPDQVLIDEFHHGFRQPVAEEMKQRWDLLLFLLGGVGVVILLGFLCRAVRFGPPLITLTTSVAPTTQFITALGLLYSAHNAVSAIQGYLTSWKRRTARRYSINPDLTGADFADTLKELGVLSLPERGRLISILEKLQTVEDGAAGSDYRRQLAADITFIEGICQRTSDGNGRNTLIK